MQEKRFSGMSISWTHVDLQTYQSPNHVENLSWELHNSSRWKTNLENELVHTQGLDDDLLQKTMWLAIETGVAAHWVAIKRQVKKRLRQRSNPSASMLWTRAATVGHSCSTSARCRVMKQKPR